VFVINKPCEGTYCQGKALLEGNRNARDVEFNLDICKLIAVRRREIA
jgi:hypothetical protein